MGAIFNVHVYMRNACGIWVLKTKLLLTGEGWGVDVVMCLTGLVCVFMDCNKLL